MGYSDPKGPTVGQAMAISGAAASPNAGYSTSGPMAFLLTIFDARLGWWLGNPRWKDASRRPGPSFALEYLLAELLANTTARTRFVNLSDGGHFDNLGSTSWCAGAAATSSSATASRTAALTFGSLGGAVRKCRADFGVEIDIDPKPIKLTNGRSTAHCVIGTILYPELDPTARVPMCRTERQLGTERGIRQGEAGHEVCARLAAVSQVEPDGQRAGRRAAYQSENPTFPHQSTGDQFFTESQFESYRRLGLHILREAFEGVVTPRTPGQGAA